MLRKYNPINAHQAGTTATQGQRPGRTLGQRRMEQRSSAVVALGAFTEGGKRNLGNTFQPHNKSTNT